MGEASHLEGEVTGSSGVVTRRSTGRKPIETDGAPLVDIGDLKAIIQLLRVVQVVIRSDSAHYISYSLTLSHPSILFLLLSSQYTNLRFKDCS